MDDMYLFKSYLPPPPFPNNPRMIGFAFQTECFTCGGKWYPMTSSHNCHDEWYHREFIELSNRVEKIQNAWNKYKIRKYKGRMFYTVRCIDGDLQVDKVWVDNIPVFKALTLQVSENIITLPETVQDISTLLLYLQHHTVCLNRKWLTLVLLLDKYGCQKELIQVVFSINVSKVSALPTTPSETYVLSQLDQGLVRNCLFSIPAEDYGFLDENIGVQAFMDVLDLQSTTFAVDCHDSTDLGPFSNRYHLLNKKWNIINKLLSIQRYNYKIHNPNTESKKRKLYSRMVTLGIKPKHIARTLTVFEIAREVYHEPRMYERREIDHIVFCLKQYDQALVKSLVEEVVECEKTPHIAKYFGDKYLLKRLLC